MRMEPRIGPDGRDDELTRGLRELLAPAGGEAFWEGLERRIRARGCGGGGGGGFRRAPLQSGSLARCLSRDRCGYGCASAGSE
jgi:hypothetical protein